MLVARRGMADMAVSNALGSNIFNITVAPWSSVVVSYSTWN